MYRLSRLIVDIDEHLRRIVEVHLQIENILSYARSDNERT